MTEILGLIAVTCAGVFLLGYCNKPPSLTKSAVKTASVLLLAVISWRAAGPLALTAALAFGALGDLFLSRAGARAFLWGLVSFAVAHLLYAWLMVSVGQGGTWLASMGVFGFGALMAWILGPKTAELRWPVMGYIVIIVVMGIAALGTMRPVIIIAALAFIASDTLIAVEKFLLAPQSRALKVTPFAVWALYWTAQALFLYGFLAV